jgi:hypothetical protein
MSSIIPEMTICAAVMHHHILACGQVVNTNSRDTHSGFQSHGWFGRLIRRRRNSARFSIFFRQNEAPDSNGHRRLDHCPAAGFPKQPRSQQASSHAKACEKLLPLQNLPVQPL